MVVERAGKRAFAPALLSGKFSAAGKMSDNVLAENCRLKMQSLCLKIILEKI